jgi:AraC-like DNA-binding protein
MVTRRTRALIAPDEDDFFFAISLAEETNVVQRNRAISCRRGDAFLGSCAEPGDASRSRPGRTLSLRLPRAALAALVPALDDVTLRPISRNIEALQLLRSYLGVLDDSHAIKTPELRQAVVAHIHELIALAVTGPADTAGNERRGVRAARLHTLKSDVLARLSQTILTAKTVARAHGMSDRYVHLLFEETGQTFGDFVEEQRMKRAFELLTDPARAEMRIGDIAAEVGYAELSTFDRAFRRWFGDTPSGVRGKR